MEYDGRGMGSVTEPLIVNRYAIYDRIAAGGMATVHLGRLLGEGGFSRTVAIKRLHAQFALDPDFLAMFLDEARLAARVRHPNVVPTLDVVAKDTEVFLVMEYIEGEPLSALYRVAHERGGRVPVDFVASLMTGVLEGLHAAHQAKDDQGEPLHIVHRDISPHNVLVGVDGVPRVIDFGVAKALGQVHTTREGQIRGKLAYMSPEQVLGRAVDSRTDVFAASVVLWEGLTGKRLFKAESDAALINLVLHGTIEPPSKHSPDLPRGIDAIVMRGLERDASRRYASADEMAAALSELVPAAPTRKVGAWVKEVGGRKLVSRAELVREIEKQSVSTSVPGREREETPPPSLAATRVRDDLSPPSRNLPVPHAQALEAPPRSLSATRIAEDIVAPSAGGSGSRSAASRSSPSTSSAVREGSQGSSVGIVAQSLLPDAPPARRLGPAILGATVGVALVIAAAVAIRSKSAPPVSTESPFVAVASPPAAPSAASPSASSPDPSPWVSAPATPASSLPVATAAPVPPPSALPPPSAPAAPPAATPASRKVGAQASPATKPPVKPPAAAPSAPIFSRY